MIKNISLVISVLITVTTLVHANDSSKAPTKDHEEQFADYMTVILGMRNMVCKNKEKKTCLESFKPFEDICKERTLVKTGNIETRAKLNEFTRRYALCLGSEKIFRETKSFWEYHDKLSEKMGINALMAKDGSKLLPREILVLKIFAEELRIHYPDELKKNLEKNNKSISEDGDDF